MLGSIQPDSVSPYGETVTEAFELAVESEPPAGMEFSASVGAAPDAYGMLLDEDGDGVYATSLPVARGAESEVHGSGGWIRRTPTTPTRRSCPAL